MPAEGALTRGDIDRLLADGSAAAQMEVARKNSSLTTYI